MRSWSYQILSQLNHAISQFRDAFSKLRDAHILVTWYNLVAPQRAPLLSKIYYCRLGGMVNFTLRSTTNEMISTSTSQTFRSWVVIFHLHQPMEFLSLNLYDTSGLAPRMNVLYWRPGDFSSKLLEQGYLAKRLKSSFRKFYGRYGDLIQQYEVSLSRMLKDIWSLTKSDFPTNQTPPIAWPWYRAWPSPIMSDFHGAFATGVACQKGTLTLLDTCFCPPLWDLLVLQLLRSDSSNLRCLYSTFHLEYPLVLSRLCLQDGVSKYNLVKLYLRNFNT